LKNKSLKINLKNKNKKNYKKITVKLGLTLSNENRYKLAVANTE
jgi:hypothetical protein